MKMHKAYTIQLKGETADGVFAQSPPEYLSIFCNYITAPVKSAAMSDLLYKLKFVEMFYTGVPTSIRFPSGS